MKTGEANVEKEYVLTTIGLNIQKDKMKLKI